jgi:hypothetical protein
MLHDEFEGRACRLDGREGVDDDPARARIDERHGGDVKTANLEDAIGDLEQSAHGQDLRLPPQARIGCVGCGPLQEFIGRHIVGNASVVPLDDGIGARGDEAARRKLEILAVVGRHKQARFLGLGHGFPPSFF